MLKAVCWAICLCVFVQSITGKSIDFNSGYQDLDDKSIVLQTDVHENEQIEDDLANGALKVICKYARIPLDVNPDSYLKCIQRLLEENRNIKLRKRSAEDDNTVPEVAGDHNVENPNIIPETKGDATTERLTDRINVPAEVATENGSEITLSVDEVKSQEPATNKTSSDEVFVPTEIAAPAEITTKNGSEITLSVSEIKQQESATNKTSSDEIIVSTEIATQNSSENPSLPVNPITDHNVENTNIIPETKGDATSERLTDRINVPAEVATENGSEITLSVDEVKSQEPATNKTSSDEIIVSTEIASQNSSENPSLPVNPITDKPLSNSSLLLTQESNILKINTINLKMLNSGETSDSTAHSSLNSTTDTPVLFKNGFDEILKNTPGKQHNISIKEDESPKGTLGSKNMQTVLLEVSKNDSSKTLEGGEISKAGESQEKSTSSPNNILLIVFAILGVVGTLAFAFNYIKKRREDREVNEMIKLEEEGRELKEIKPLMKNNFEQNGSKSLEYIDADPQLQVDKETKDERN